jgi:glycosyltransferase involved in cell wall biosynthesis
MKIILFTHPNFLNSQSMPRYANFLFEGLKKRGHDINIWKPKAFFYNFSKRKSVQKWLGYIDQYLVFPFLIRKQLKACPSDTLFVFADQALGPWVPLVKKKPHVVHCHDFMALRSAKKKVAENKTGITGKMYQRYIQKGFSKGKNFIAISKKTKSDLRFFHQGKIDNCAICYNGFNRIFIPVEKNKARNILSEYVHADLSNGYFLHVGGNQFYKNRKGVLEIYTAWRKKNKRNIPLLLIGANPNDELLSFQQNSTFKKDIYFLTDFSDELMSEVYSGAICLLFPSLDEGFGWPIIEAMACGCAVITTKKQPMIEVAGEAGIFIPRKPSQSNLVNNWAEISATQLETFLKLSETEKSNYTTKGFQQASLFNAENSIDKIESFYLNILSKSKKILK